MTTTSSGNVPIICGTILLLAVLASIVVLALHGTISGTLAMGGIGTIITLGGGALANHLGVLAGVKAATTSTTK